MKCALDRKVERTYPVSAAERELLISLFFYQQSSKAFVSCESTVLSVGRGLWSVPGTDRTVLFSIPELHQVLPLILVWRERLL